MSKRKFREKFLSPREINFKNHWAIGTNWPIIGSRGDKYNVRFTENGFTCECIGMTVHGKCKHTREISERWLMSAT